MLVRSKPRKPGIPGLQGMRVMVSGETGSNSVAELEVRGLVKRYSAQSVVGPISYSVTAGEFVSLLGPSGFGKTTTLRCIAGFETPTDGSIFLDGARIERLPPNPPNIGRVFHTSRSQR